MANFKLKLKKPERILKFDDSDLSECQLSRDSSGCDSLSSPAMKNEMVLPRSVPNHLLLTSILEQLCIMYSNNSKQAQEIFKSICEQLAKLSVVSPLLMMDEMSSLRTQYRHSVHRMLIAAIHKSNKGSLLSLMSPKLLGHGYLPALPSSLPSQPSTSSEDMINQTSRYDTEFVEIDKIGRGGFGSVYKCKNKLDGKLYAIKKVKLKQSKPEVWFRVLREVKALASLQHQNIVGYNSAWLEYGVMGQPQPSSGDTAFNIPELSNNCLDVTDDPSVIFFDSREPGSIPGVARFEDNVHWGTGPRIRELDDSEETSSPPTKGAATFLHRHNSQNDMASYKTRKSYLDSEFHSKTVISEVLGTPSRISKQTFMEETYTESVQRNGSHVMFTLDDSSSELDDGIDGERGGKRLFGRSISCDPLASGEMVLPGKAGSHPAGFTQAEFPLQKTVTLFIQMELCGPTLKDWMQARNERCKCEEDFISYTKDNMNIFRQILKSVDYIHSQGLIHRDLKPRNIFLREDSLHVKVGDFGLATDDIFSESPSLEVSESFFGSPPYAGIVRTGSMLSDHTSGVGTSTYAAPEQLDSCVYNTKSDIYSLGVILFELFQNYDTEMERYKSLGDLRKTIIPEPMYRCWPVQVKYLKLMTSTVAGERPSVRELLSGELFLSKDQVIEDMKAQQIENVKEIERLKKLLSEKDKILTQKNVQIDDLMQEINSSIHFSGSSV